MDNKKIGLYSLLVSIGIILAIALGLAQRDPNPDLNLKPTSSSISQQKQPIEYTTNTSSEPNKNQSRQDVETDFSNHSVTFIAGGDISLSRAVAFNIDKYKDPLFPFRNIADELKSTDFNFANLETPFSDSDKYTAKDTLVFNAPKKNIAGLKEYNFKIVNLANNHAMDQGEDGLNITKKWLTENNIQSVGTGADLDQAWLPEIVEVNDIKIGFIGASYSSINDGGKGQNNFVARIEDTSRLKNSITSLKGQGADFVVVTMHAGTEYTRQPNKSQVDFARSAVDNGADIVIGAHPHWVQTMEKYKDKYIFYSLGNFVFDQSWSKETQKGLLLKISIDKKFSGFSSETKLSSIKLEPIIIGNDTSVRLANPEETKEITSAMKATADEVINW